MFRVLTCHETGTTPSSLRSHFARVILASPLIKSLPKTSPRDLPKQGKKDSPSSRVLEGKQRQGWHAGTMLLGLVQAWRLLDQVSTLTKVNYLLEKHAVAALYQVLVAGDGRAFISFCNANAYYPAICSWTTGIMLRVSITSSLYNISKVQALLSDISSPPCLTLCI